MKPLRPTTPSRCRIAIVGENADNDSEPVKILLSRYFGTDIQFDIIIKGLKGSQLDTPKFIRRLGLTIKVADDDKTPFDHVVVIRDLDEPFDEKSTKYADRLKFFNDCQKCIADIGIFMLNVTELEALILADPDAIHKKYGVRVQPQRTDRIQDVKEVLKTATNRKYSQSDSEEIFGYLNLDTVESNNPHFKDFIKEFMQKTGLRRLQ